jgi:hypothetical protein
VVVDGREVGDEQHRELGQPEFVDGLVGQPFDAAHHVVAEVADEASGQRRQAGQPRRFHCPPGGAQHGERVAGGGQPGRHRARPRRLAVDDGQ